MERPAAHGARPPRSPQVSIAQIAGEVIAHMSGEALTAGPNGRWVTRDGDQAIRGVLVAAQSDGRYELELHLVVTWPPEPLAHLAQDVRRRVRAAVKREGLGPHLGDIQIRVDDIQSPADPDASSQEG